MNGNRENDLIADWESLAGMMNDCSIDRVMAIDQDWKIIAWNSTSELVTGLLRSDILGRHLLEAFPAISNDEEMIQAIKEAFNGRKSFLPSNSRTFNRTYWENHFIPLINQQGNVLGVMNLMHDVAHRIKAERQLQKLNTELQKKYRELEKANRELAEFNVITSQEIKEPLKHVYTSLELLVKKEAQSLTNMSKGNLRRMQGSLNKMNLLIDDLLIVSGITTNDEELQQVDLNVIVKESLQQLRKKIDERNARVQVEQLCNVDGYPKMLTLLFKNLIDNAIKFHEEDSTPEVHISSGEIEGHESNIPALNPDHTYVWITVRDNGIGFNEEDGERIFRMFDRLHERRFSGSGVGLTVSRKIVDAHDGVIAASSTPGEGSVFVVYLPNGRTTINE